MPSIAARRSASIVSCGKRASASANSSARSRWRPAGTTSVTRPIACASSASTIRPVRIRSSARPSPTMRGSRCVPPSISGTPQRRSGKPSVESSRGDPQVAPQRQLEPAGQAPAGDRGDRRLRRDHAREAERAARVVQARAEALDRLQVGAGAERHAAGAGEDQHARVVVGLEAVVGVGDQLGGGPVDRVAPLLAVDRDERRGAAALVGHGSMRGTFSEASHRAGARGRASAVQRTPPRTARPRLPPGAVAFQGLPADALAELRGLALLLALLERRLEPGRERSRRREEDHHAEREERDDLSLVSPERPSPLSPAKAVARRDQPGREERARGAQLPHAGSERYPVARRGRVLHVHRRDPEGEPEQVRVRPRDDAIKLDRFLFSSVVYPTDYGFIPDTLSRTATRST